MRFKVNFPVEIFFGEGEADHIGEIAKKYGKTAFAVIDPFLKGSAVEERVERKLTEAGVEAVPFYEVVPNPTVELIDKGAEMVRNGNYDMVIAIGGGSSIDTGKAIALLATNEGSCWEYTERLGANVVRPKVKGLPLISVPTTAGTGSEATPYAVINNPAIHQKCTIVSPMVFPVASIVDPELMMTMPPALTALTGVDAFSHAFESYINVNAHPFSEMVALESIKRFAGNIVEAVKNGSDIKARREMALACTFGGMAIAHAGTTVPHALGQPLSGLTNAPHGGTIAACLPEVVEWTLPVAAEKFAVVAEILDPSLKTESVNQKASRLPLILENLFKEIGADVTFGGYGLKEDEIEGFADTVYTSFQLDLKGHPKVATREDIIYLIRQCM
ncbi:iron-containing alcohol dehydrogenase [Caldanaerobius polysaccharolyticus]|uniref:iron-containing alcohol dehydrogenase n=1 Tax=Caldanaerobius polysaccharolyticus TaxID=44256 RepID=UPI00047DC72D|nr:iron-containing alcohol dehydrogenase [Caldanaerobius polysaccharolyticus]